jgi:hypothetical protein
LYYSEESKDSNYVIVTLVISTGVIITFKLLNYIILWQIKNQWLKKPQKK